MNRIHVLLSSLLLALASPAAGATSTVSTGDALWATLKGAHPGDVVRLASGNYPPLRFDNFVIAAPGVTVVPAPGAKPVLGGLAMNGSKGLNFADLDVAISDPSIQKAVNISGGDRITFNRMIFRNSAGARGAKGGVGAFVRESSNVSILNSEFYNLGVGVSFMDDKSVVLKHSRFHDLETDGVDTSGTIDVTIEGNIFSDFYPDPQDHPDAIQFWGTKLNPVGKDAIVINNVIRRGKGGPMPMQGIFAEHQSNMTIRGNGLVCTLYNGISLSDTATAIIEDNFVQGCPDIGTRIIVRGGSSDIVLRNNQISERIVDLHQAGEPDNVRLSMKGNKSIGSAKVGDSKDLDTWLAARAPAKP